MHKIAIILLICSLKLAVAQPVLNERYDLGYSNAILGSVIATDSCYYSCGLAINSTNSNADDPVFIKYNFDGSIAIQNQTEFDTLIINVWQKNNLIATQDGNFAVMARAQGLNSYAGFMFLKFDPAGDTIVTHYIDTFLVEGNIAIEGSILIENEDSTFYGISIVSRLSDVMGGGVFYKLSKTGEVIYHKYFWGISTFTYRLFIANSLIKTAINELILGGSMVQTGGSNQENYRAITKLYRIDTLGTIINQYDSEIDTIRRGCNGLTPTVDDGWLYCGKYGRYFTENNSLDFQRSITKLDANFEKEWDIRLDTFTVGFFMGYREILKMNDSEYVAVGYGGFWTSPAGILTKFNLEGEVLWDRRYAIIGPTSPGDYDYPDHRLYDISQTTDSGFVMVGEAVNHESPGSPIGQQAWLVKVDKHGCLVPDCQLYDNPVDTTDTVVVVPPIEPMPDVLYPNPANQEIYYYHHQNEFTGKAEGFIYNAAGQRIYYWRVDQNDITYIIDTGSLESGMYMMHIKEGDEVVRTEKFVVEH